MIYVGGLNCCRGPDIGHNNSTHYDQLSELAEDDVIITSSLRAASISCV